MLFFLNVDGPSFISYYLSLSRMSFSVIHICNIIDLLFLVFRHIRVKYLKSVGRLIVF